MTSLFQLGRIVITPDALDHLNLLGIRPERLLDRHVAGDWGDLSPIDRMTNLEALMSGDRLMSAYMVGASVKIWIITEASREVTTILCPENY